MSVTDTSDKMMGRTRPQVASALVWGSVHRGASQLSGKGLSWAAGWLAGPPVCPARVCDDSPAAKEHRASAFAAKLEAA